LTDPPLTGYKIIQRVGVLNSLLPGTPYFLVNDSDLTVFVIIKMTDFKVAAQATFDAF